MTGTAAYAPQRAYAVTDGGAPLAKDPATIVAVTVQVVAELGYDEVRAA
jgi:hypothetical protein